MGAEAQSSLQDLGLALRYNSAEADVVTDFYVPCLNVAERYDRAVGYFRSSVYHLVGVAVSDFALRGGRMRLVCSPALTQEDLGVLQRQSSGEDRMSLRLQDEIEQLIAHPENLPVVELLATLIAAGILHVKIAYKPGEYGIFHDKLGILHSASDSLSFIGSSNETYMAWDPDANHEGFEIFGSWDESDERRVAGHVSYFDALWNDSLPGLCTVELPEVPRSVLEKHANDAGIEAAVEKARLEFRRRGRAGSARRRTLLDHQTLAADNWWQERRGIIDHATGSGKTVTALEVMRRWLAVGRDRAAIVFVPSDLLSQQWLREIERELQHLSPRMLTAGGALSQSDWRDNLSAFTSPGRLGARISVATIQTAASDDFVERVQGGEHLLVVADEVHRVGSADRRRVLDIEAGGRLGLSATPERFGDPEGTEAIFRYFGPVLPPSFTIADAQKAGRLVPYDYFVHTLCLTDDETARYRRLSSQIAQLRARAARDASSSQSSRLNMLLIARARIVKKASEKLPSSLAIISREAEKGDRWLVYCEDGEQLDAVKDGLTQLGIETLEYHSSMVGDRPATLAAFERYGGVLVSIRCLDEGVDIPAIDHALILASSVNPREYIQRRGRVLRFAPDKYSAEIHDVLVCIEEDDRTRVLNRDLERAKQFAAVARNEACRFRLDALEDEMAEADEQLESDDEDVAW